MTLEARVADLEFRLREVVRERDQAYDDRNRARAQRDEARADNADLLARLDAAAFAVPHGLREVAEKQREACVAMLARLSPDIPYIQVVRNTPLVTENK